MNKDIFKKDIKDIFKMEVSLKGILIKVVILLAVLSYGYFGLYPQYEKYVSTKNSVKQATQKLNTYKEKTALMPKYEKQLKNIENELNEKSKNLLYDMQDGLFLIGLDKKMKTYNIDLTSYDVGNIREYEHFYGILTTISVRGDYRNVKKLMVYLEEQKNVTQILDYTMTSYIEPEQEEQETTSNKDLIKNVNINKDTKIYWVEGEDKWHLYNDCPLIKEGEILKNDKLLDRSTSYLCNTCVLRAATEKETKKEVATPEAEGVVEATFKFIMYTKENTTMILDTDNPSSWRPGKYNPFKSSAK